MSPQDCDNCYYPAPSVKKTPEVPEAPLVDPEVPEEECPQCFYQDGVTEAPAEDSEECPQCFYQPETDEEKNKEEAEDCSQCFYQPTDK